MEHDDDDDDAPWHRSLLLMSTALPSLLCAVCVVMESDDGRWHLQADEEERLPPDGCGQRIAGRGQQP